jgi:hypothetical protein
MRKINSTRHGATPVKDARRRSRLVVPASLATVGCILALGQVAHADAKGLAAASQTNYLRTLHSADAAERWLAAAKAGESRHGRVVRLSSPAGTGITTVDVGGPGQTVGDYLIFNHPVLDPAMTRELGDLRGQCVFVEDALCEGDVTFELASGLITVEGPFDLTRGTNVFAITGGTGAYATARGVLRVTSTDERNDYVLRVAG